MGFDRLTNHATQMDCEPELKIIRRAFAKQITAAGGVGDPRGPGLFAARSVRFYSFIRTFGPWGGTPHRKTPTSRLTGTGRGIVRPTRRRGTSCSSSRAISAAASAGRYSRTRSPRRGSAEPVIGAGHHFLLVAPSSHSTSRWRHEERTSRASNARIS
jgi:hypothetical protein